jgi:hypothetical protein
MVACTVVNTGCRWLNHNSQTQLLFEKNKPKTNLNAWFRGQLLIFYLVQSIALSRVGGQRHQAFWIGGGVPSLIWKSCKNSIKSLTSFLGCLFVHCGGSVDQWCTGFLTLPSFQLIAQGNGSENSIFVISKELSAVFITGNQFPKYISYTLMFPKKLASICCP